MTITAHLQPRQKLTATAPALFATALRRFAGDVVTAVAGFQITLNILFIIDALYS